MQFISNGYATLAAAICLEIIGTILLQKSVQFTKALPTLGMAACYIGAFYFLSHTLKSMPVGVAYGIWSGVGLLLISLIGHFFLRQSLDLPAMIGLGLIIAGVVIIHFFSRTIQH